MVTLALLPLSFPLFALKMSRLPDLCAGVFVGSGIFKSGDPVKRATAMVLAANFWNNPLKLAEVSENIGEAMVGRIVDDTLTVRMAAREGHSWPQ